MQFILRQMFNLNNPLGIEATLNENFHVLLHCIGKVLLVRIFMTQEEDFGDDKI